MSKLSGWFAARRKAFAAVVVPLIVFLAAQRGLNLAGDWAATVAALIAGTAVYTVPNA